MISTAIAITIVIILLVLRFRPTYATQPQPTPTQAGQSGPQAPPAANTAATAVPAKMGNWSYVAIVAIGLISGIIAYQFEKSGSKEKPQEEQKQVSSAPAPVAMTMPFAQVAAGAAPPPPSINISGDWSFDWGNTPSDFRISHIGNSFSGKSNYNPGVMVVKGLVTGNCADGTWELIGNPNGHFQGEFHITSLSGTAGEGSWITYENGPPSSRLIINRI
jgi:hypothetical protein